MPEFSDRSWKRLETCHPDLQLLFQEVIRHYDCSILEGWRSEEDQNRAVHEGKSKTPWPESKHNDIPSNAVDVAPYPIDWNNKKRFYHFAGFVLGIAKMMGIKVRYGGDWDSDNDLDDQTFNDLVHWELIENDKK